MAIAAKGYSGTPLAAKLGLRDGMAVGFIGLPPELDALAGAADFGSVDRLENWWDAAGATEHYDLLHGFTRRRSDLESLGALQRAIRRYGTIWVSWPKKAAKVETDVTEDVVRSAALALDLVDVKVAAVDAVWSGLKLVVRKDRR